MNETNISRYCEKKQTPVTSLKQFEVSLSLWVSTLQPPVFPLLFLMLLFYTSPSLAVLFSLFSLVNVTGRWARWRFQSTWPPPVLHYRRSPLLHRQWFVIALVGAVLCIVSLMQWLMSGAGNLGEWEAGWWPTVSTSAFWHVSVCTALELLFGHCQRCSLCSLSQPSFPFQSQPHECKKLWPKINNTTQERNGRKGEGKNRQREKGRGRKERKNREQGSFSPLLFLQKCPLFYFPPSFIRILQWMALQTKPYPEWRKFISVAAP